jgi:hypothetical protein
MLDKNKSMEMLNGFQNAYNYDTTYMKLMLEENINAYETFEAFLPMASFKETMNTNAIFLVKITAMKNEDCGACLQLNIDMAIEAGVDKDLIKDIISNEGKNLNPTLKRLYDFTLLVTNNKQIEQSFYDKINIDYSKAMLVEISLAIASAKVFPTLKRVLNDIQSCSVIKIKV